MSFFLIYISRIKHRDHTAFVVCTPQHYILYYGSIITRVYHIYQKQLYYHSYTDIVMCLNVEQANFNKRPMYEKHA